MQSTDDVLRPPGGLRFNRHLRPQATVAVDQYGFDERPAQIKPNNKFVIHQSSCSRTKDDPRVAYRVGHGFGQHAFECFLTGAVFKQ